MPCGNSRYGSAVLENLSSRGVVILTFTLAESVYTISVLSLVSVGKLLVFVMVLITSMSFSQARKKNGMSKKRTSRGMPAGVFLMLCNGSFGIGQCIAVKISNCL